MDSDHQIRKSDGGRGGGGEGGEEEKWGNEKREEKVEKDLRILGE